MNTKRRSQSGHRICRMPNSSDETGSMAIVLLVTLVGLALSALLVPMIITQDRTTRYNITRVHELNAAQAGIDTVLGLIRQAEVSGGIASSSTLPCGPLSGKVSTAGSARYDVTIEYFTADPVKVQLETVPADEAMICVPGYGAYKSGQSTPGYARVISTGRDSAENNPTNGSSADRTLVTTYAFKTSNSNIAGGQIRIYPASASSVPLCMDAGSATPIAGVSVFLQACGTSTPAPARQVFAYRKDLTIGLVSSKSTSYPFGLCLSISGSPTNGGAVTLIECQSDRPPYTQQWSFNDSGAYQMGLANSSVDGVLSPYCLSVASQSVGIPLRLAGCDGETTSSLQAWIPMPSVGAGGASAFQWINYSEFGRCLDVTGQNPDANHLIDYPCKQNPSGAVAWNQTFTPPGIAAGATNGTGTFKTRLGVLDYCLTSPGTNKGYVTVKLCIPGTATQAWKLYNADKSLSYSMKNTIVDNTGRCLGLTDRVGTEVWSAIDVETCNGSTAQKWNADANLSTPTLQNTREIPKPPESNPVPG